MIIQFEGPTLKGFKSYDVFSIYSGCRFKSLWNPGIFIQMGSITFELWGEGKILFFTPNQ